jgi:hypothetical protein
MSVIIPNNNPYVVQKETSQANSLDAEVRKLQLEDAEITKTLAAMSPSHPSYSVLQARQSIVRTAVKNKTNDEK